LRKGKKYASEAEFLSTIATIEKTHNFLTIPFFYPNNSYICDSKY